MRRDLCVENPDKLSAFNARCADRVAMALTNLPPT